MFCYFLACFAVVWMSRNAPPKEGEPCVTSKKRLRGRLALQAPGSVVFWLFFLQSARWARKGERSLQRSPQFSVFSFSDGAWNSPIAIKEYDTLMLCLSGSGNSSLVSKTHVRHVFKYSLSITLRRSLHFSLSSPFPPEKPDTQAISNTNDNGRTLRTEGLRNCAYKAWFRRRTFLVPNLTV